MTFLATLLLFGALCATAAPHRYPRYNYRNEIRRELRAQQRQLRNEQRAAERRIRREMESSRREWRLQEREAWREWRDRLRGWRY